MSCGMRFAPLSGPPSRLPFIPFLDHHNQKTGRWCFSELDSSRNSEGPTPERGSQILSDPCPSLRMGN